MAGFIYKTFILDRLIMSKILTFFSFVVFFALFTHPVYAQSQRHNFIRLSSEETRFGDYGRIRGRAHNVRLAAEKISTIRLEPGETFSFNETVGPRTLDAGFEMAPVISGGELIDGPGGGVCQVASTFYSAVLHAGLEIIEHYPHSRVSSYIEPGLDATVVYGQKDLVVKNTLPHSVEIVTSYDYPRRPIEGFVKTEVFAEEQLFFVEIDLVKRVLQRPQVKFVTNENLEPGERSVVESGSPRLYVRTIVKIRSYEAMCFYYETQTEAVYQSVDRVVEISPKNN